MMTSPWPDRISGCAAARSAGSASACFQSGLAKAGKPDCGLIQTTMPHRVSSPGANCNHCPDCTPTPANGRLPGSFVALPTIFRQHPHVDGFHQEAPAGGCRRGRGRERIAQGVGEIDDRRDCRAGRRFGRLKQASRKGSAFPAVTPTRSWWSAALIRRIRFGTSAARRLRSRHRASAGTLHIRSTRSGTPPLPCCAVVAETPSETATAAMTRTQSWATNRISRADPAAVVSAAAGRRPPSRPALPVPPCRPARPRGRRRRARRSGHHLRRRRFARTPASPCSLGWTLQQSTIGVSTLDARSCCRWHADARPAHRVDQPASRVR